MTLVLHSDGTEFFCDQCKATINRTRDNPFPEHTCKLDLRAVEVRLRRITPGQEEAFAAGYGLPVYPDPTREEFFTLLAHCRALRTVLRPLLDREQPAALGDIERAAAVLAQAVDSTDKERE